MSDPYGSPPPGYGTPYGSGPPPGYGGPPGYGYGPGYYPPGFGGYPPPRKTNGLAIWSLILGLLGVVTCQLVGIPGLILGIIARRQIRERGEDGAGLALGGIIASAIACVLLVVVVAVYGVLLASIGTSGRSSTGSGSYRTTTSVGSRPATTERVAPVPGTGVRPRGTSTTQAPSGELALGACPAVTFALKNLEEPAKYESEASLPDSAVLLHTQLPASYADDIDTLFADALGRAGLDPLPAPTGEAAEADHRLQVFIAAACP